METKLSTLRERIFPSCLLILQRYRYRRFLVEFPRGTKGFASRFPLSSRKRARPFVSSRKRARPFVSSARQLHQAIIVSWQMEGLPNRQQPPSRRIEPRVQRRLSINIPMIDFNRALAILFFRVSQISRNFSHHAKRENFPLFFLYPFFIISLFYLYPLLYPRKRFLIVPPTIHLDFLSFLPNFIKKIRVRCEISLSLPFSFSLSLCSLADG